MFFRQSTMILSFGGFHVVVLLLIFVVVVRSGFACRCVCVRVDFPLYSALSTDEIWRF